MAVEIYVVYTVLCGFVQIPSADAVKPRISEHTGDQMICSDIEKQQICTFRPTQAIHILVMIIPHT